MSLEEIYIRLMNQYLTLEDTPDNAVSFEILLDLIAFCEENRDASLADYREFKAIILAEGPLPRCEARCLN